MKEEFMKNLKPIIFIVIVLILTAISAYPQRKFSGRVIEVIDGKTFVIQLQSGKVTAVLQYIEIPEPEQPLYQTVKEHLQNLIFDKTVEFKPRFVTKEKTVVGQLLVKGVDVSQQMLRDGAAWYSIAEKNGQDSDQSVIYQDNEAQAKTEKRGVWSIENLKPAWEFRAEKEELRKQQEKLAQQNYATTSFVDEMQRKQKKQVQRQVAPQTEMWADVSGAGEGLAQTSSVGGLYSAYNASVRVGYICTSSILLDVSGNDFLRKIESRVFYVYRGDQTRINDSVYALAFMSTSKEYKFLKSNGLTIIADKQKITLPLGKRFYRENYQSVQELLVYKISRSQLTKIANAKNISVKIGRFSGGIAGESVTYVNNLLNASN